MNLIIKSKNLENEGGKMDHARRLLWIQITSNIEFLFNTQINFTKFLPQINEKLLICFIIMQKDHILK